LLICFSALVSTFYFLRNAEPVYQAQVLIVRVAPQGKPKGDSSIDFVDQYSQALLNNLVEVHTAVLNSASSIAMIKERLEKEHHLQFEEWQIQDHLSLRFQKDSPIIQLTATAETPERAQALANVAAEVDVQKMNDMERADVNQGLAFLQEQMRSVNAKLEAAEETLNRLKANEKNTVTPKVDALRSRSTSALLDQLQALETELSKTEMDLNLTEAQLKSVRNFISEAERVSSLPSQIGPIQSQLVQMQLKLDALLQNFTEKDPEVASTRRQVDALKERLDSELAKIRQNGQSSAYSTSELQSLVQQAVSLEVRLQGLIQQQTVLKQKIEAFKNAYPEQTRKQIELTSLERQARVLEQTYMTLLEKSEELSLLKQMERNQLHIIDQAELPVFPAGSPKRILLLLSGLLGLGLGIGVAFFWELLDDSIKRKEDVEKHLALPVSGAIPKMKPFKVPAHALANVDSPNGGLMTGAAQPEGTSRKDRKRLDPLLSHILLFADHNSPVVKDYQTLAANIKYGNGKRPIKTLLITSGVPGEGKTSTAANLAISLAQTGQKVLLVDMDLRNSQIHHIFRQVRLPGLTDFLADDESSTDCPLGEPFIRATEIDNLYLFPAGDPISDVEMLLNSEKMECLVNSLKGAYDIVLFDSPPLLASADALTLATYMDGTLMVIKSGKTKHEVAFQAKELLENVNAEILGVVLNAVDYSKSGSYYYYDNKTSTKLRHN
jgi:capsular exopolysaccharide synthesis family protein